MNSRVSWKLCGIVDTISGECLDFEAGRPARTKVPRGLRDQLLTKVELCAKIALRLFRQSENAYSNVGPAGQKTTIEGKVSNPRAPVDRKSDSNLFAKVKKEWSMKAKLVLKLKMLGALTASAIF